MGNDGPYCCPPYITLRALQSSYHGNLRLLPMHVFPTKTAHSSLPHYALSSCRIIHKVGQRLLDRRFCISHIYCYDMNLLQALSRSPLTILSFKSRRSTGPYNPMVTTASARTLGFGFPDAARAPASSVAISPETTKPEIAATLTAPDWSCKTAAKAARAALVLLRPSVVALCTCINAVFRVS